MEYIDIIDRNDTVVGKASRDEVYRNHHPHRIVHVMLFDAGGRLLLQKRSASRSYLPHYWVTSAGGHVQSGESFEDAAYREMNEELQVKVPLQLMYKDWFEDERKLPKFLGTFHGGIVHKPQFNQEEVEDAVFASMDDIGQMVRNGEKFHPELLYLLEKHYSVDR